jgi:hypothetical protein
MLRDVSAAAMPDGGIVTLRTRCTDLRAGDAAVAARYAVMEVSDTGTGQGRQGCEGERRGHADHHAHRLGGSGSWPMEVRCFTGSAIGTMDNLTLNSRRQ